MSIWLRIWADPLYRLLLLVSLVQMGLLLLVIVVIVLIRLRRQRDERRRGAIAEALFDPLMRYAAGEASMGEIRRHLRGYPRAHIARELEKYVTRLDGHARVRLQTLYRALGLREWSLRLGHSSLWWRRLEGVRMMNLAGGGEDVESLIERMQDEHPAVRLGAARALARSGSAQAVAPLMEMAAGATHQGSRRQLAQTLATLGSTAHPALREVLRTAVDSDGDERFVATTLEVLALTGDMEAAPEIRAALSSQRSEIRVAAFKAVQLLRLPLERDELVAGLEDDQWPVRAQAASAAGVLGLTSVLPELQGCLGDEAWWVRQNAGEALGRMGAEGFSALERVRAHSGDAFARDMAARTLSNDPHYELRRTSAARSESRERSSQEASRDWLAQRRGQWS